MRFFTVRSNESSHFRHPLNPSLLNYITQMRFQNIIRYSTRNKMACIPTTSSRTETIRSLSTDIPNSDCPRVSNAPAKSNSFCKTRISLPQTGQFVCRINNRMLINFIILAGTKLCMCIIRGCDGAVRAKLMKTEHDDDERNEKEGECTGRMFCQSRTGAETTSKLRVLGSLTLRAT